MLFAHTGSEFFLIPSALSFIKRHHTLIRQARMNKIVISKVMNVLYERIYVPPCLRFFYFATVFISVLMPIPRKSFSKDLH